MTTQTHLEKAVARPWTVYGDPQDVLADDTLSDAQKRRVLENWERDARELAVAEEENMGGGEPDRLDRVLQALATLPPVEEHPRGPATKHGTQPSPDPEPAAPALSGEEARQGEIILKNRKRQAIFTAGLVAAAILVVMGFYFA